MEHFEPAKKGEHLVEPNDLLRHFHPRLASVARAVATELNKLGRQPCAPGTAAYGALCALKDKEIFHFSPGATQFGTDAVGFLLAAEYAVTNRGPESLLNGYVQGYRQFFGADRAAVAHHHEQGEALGAQSAEFIHAHCPPAWLEFTAQFAQLLGQGPIKSETMLRALRAAYPESVPQRPEEGGRWSSLVLPRLLRKQGTLPKASEPASPAIEVLGDVLASSAATAAYLGYRLGPEFLDDRCRAAFRIVQDSKDLLAQLSRSMNVEVPSGSLRLLDLAGEVARWREEFGRI